MVKFNAMAACAVVFLLSLSSCGTAGLLQPSTVAAAVAAPVTPIPQESFTQRPADSTQPPATATTPPVVATTPPASATAQPVATPQWTPVTGTSLGNPPDDVLTIRILLADGNFDPKVVAVPLGAKVVWWTTEHWVDQTLKTDDGVVLGTPFLFKALEYFFTAPGTYNYYDDFSPWVKGTVIVY